LIGGLGFAPSANIGNKVAIFEAVHGSAPKYAGKNVINPTALILSGVMMLRHLEEFEAAESIENALHVTLDSGVRTRDVAGDVGAVSTTQFTDAIISNLGNSLPQWSLPVRKPLHLPETHLDPEPPTDRRVVGVDIFVESRLNPEALGTSIAKLTSEAPFSLQLISNRGTKVYPAMGAMTDCVDQYRCRFLFKKSTRGLTYAEIDAQIFDLVQQVATDHKWAHLEKLQEFNGKQGFTKDQGEN
ncbi:MAG: isocitrate dehydrogenase, partial [Chloroflexi bacterium]|nr:isocitrate dehydrogenase [Chloroflexota bacterium]